MCAWSAHTPTEPYPAAPCYEPAQLLAGRVQCITQHCAVGLLRVCRPHDNLLLRPHPCKIPWHAAAAAGGGGCVCVSHSQHTHAHEITKRPPAQPAAPQHAWQPSLSHCTTHVCPTHRGTDGGRCLARMHTGVCAWHSTTTSLATPSSGPQAMQGTRSRVPALALQDPKPQSLQEQNPLKPACTTTPTLVLSPVCDSMRRAADARHKVAP